MSRMRLLPYRTLSDDDLAWGGWWFERQGVRAPLPELLPGWDYSSGDRIGITVDIESSRVAAGSEIDEVDRLEVVAVVDCPSTLKRFVQSVRLQPLSTQQVEVAIDLPPGAVAQALDLSALLLLAEDIPPAPRRASRRGSRLANGPERRVLLEGDASRFPTEAVSFKNLNLEHAPWTLNAVFFDLTDSFMGSVRLLVNEDHELGREVLVQDVETVTDARLKLEVLRSLVAVAAAQEVVVDDEYPPDSIGEVIDSMCRVFLNRTIFEAVQSYQRYPIKFDRLLYAGVGA